MDQFTLEKNKHFTPSGLLSYLNKDFGAKLAAKTYMYGGRLKTSYNLNDIHHYVLNGKLPEYLGNSELREIHIPFTDLKIIELTWK